MTESSATIMPIDSQARNAAAQDDASSFDTAVAASDTVTEKLADAQTSGYQAEFDPGEAESAGAFVEDALSEADALASAQDSAHIAPHSSPPRF